jgi:hypothetical protein
VNSMGEIKLDDPKLHVQREAKRPVDAIEQEL